MALDAHRERLQPPLSPGIAVGDLVWSPGEALSKSSGVARFMAWLGQSNRHFKSYDELWQWSATEIEEFWLAIWQYFEVSSSTPYECVLTQRAMPGARWFPGAHVNYARHLLSCGAGTRTAIFAANETESLRRVSWAELQDSVYACATALRALGVKPGDRVAAYLPNVAEAVIAFLASASIGAVWSSCSPDFGASSVIDRFRQIAPKVLIAVSSYVYAGKTFDRREHLQNMLSALPSIEHLVLVPSPLSGAEPAGVGVHAWADLLQRHPRSASEFRFEDTAFDDPLWIVYSSGTTGLPKAFVHGHGGFLLEALKFSHFHLNLSPSSCMFYFTTTGWIMWNLLTAGLVTGAAIVLYDGNPMAPDPAVLWRLVEDAGITLFGASPTFINQQMKAGIRPRRQHDLGSLRTVMLSGSPVTPENMVWCYEELRRDIWVTSQSGGADVASAFVGGVPLLPVYAAEIQARLLGVDAQAFDENGRACVDRVGELVVCKPMPSMPLYFWNDPGDHCLRESYFEVYPGVWRHGDYIQINSRGGCVIHGRSDSTLNRNGVRIGTAEIYRAVEAIAEIRDSLIVNLDLPGGRFFMPLFVVLGEAEPLTEALEHRIRETLRERCSPRHVPDKILQVEAVPYTLTGKKMEIPVRKILLGSPVAKAASRDAMANPDALEYFVDYAFAQTDYQVVPHEYGNAEAGRVVKSA